MRPPVVWFAYTPNRKGNTSQEHLESFNGTRQAAATKRSTKPDAWPKPLSLEYRRTATYQPQS
nr:hypothetical protein [Burkholderia territorii]